MNGFNVGLWPKSNEKKKNTPPMATEGGGQVGT